MVLLRDFNLDFVGDHDAVNIAAQVGPKDGEGGHGRGDVDFDDGEDDG